LPPPATEAPYGTQGQALPRTLADALAALDADTALRGGLGGDVVDWYRRLKASEVSRHEAAADKAEWDRREYFGRL
jgi:glutamine synthetase